MSFSSRVLDSLRRRVTATAGGVPQRMREKRLPDADGPDHRYVR